MKVLIRTDSSSHIGAGHLMRCLAFSQHCRERGIDVYFLACEQLSLLAKRLENEGFSHRMMGYVIGSQEDLEETCKIFSEIKAEWLLVDGYHFPKEYYEKLAANKVKLISISDYDLPYEFTDMVINQNHWGQSIPYPHKSIKFLGNQYLLLRKEFWEYKKSNIKPDNKVNNIVITMGGSDPCNVTAEVIHALEKIQKKRLTVHVVLGAGYEFEEVLKANISDSFHNYQISIDVNNMAKVLQAADLVITAAGSTCWELVYMRKPSLITCLADNQEKVMNTMSECGYGVALGWFNQDLENRIRKALTAILEDDTIIKNMVNKMNDSTVASMTHKIFDTLLCYEN